MRWSTSRSCGPTFTVVLPPSFEKNVPPKLSARLSTLFTGDFIGQATPYVPSLVSFLLISANSSQVHGSAGVGMRTFAASSSFLLAMTTCDSCRNGTP